MKLYLYKNCRTCQKAKKFLQKKHIDFTEIPIRETPPNKQELSLALQQLGDKKFLFNRSGKDYRKQNLKNSLPTMTDEQAIQKLQTNGNLVKRPFLVMTNKKIFVGFKLEQWENIHE